MMLSIKKKDFVGYIEKIKTQVVAHKQTLKLCSEIANLSDNVKSLVNTSERLTNEITITKNVSKILEIRNVNLEKDLSKNDQYGRRNNFEISEKSKSRSPKFAKTRLSIYHIWISKFVTDVLYEGM